MASIEKCNAIVQDLRASDPKLKMLLDNLNNEKWHIACLDCTKEHFGGNARAFITTDSEIVLCVNKQYSRETIQQSLHHEATHAYDYTHKRYDFSTCEGLAHSEVRAAREAECSGWYVCEWLRNSCIKTTATNSTKNMFPNSASYCVKKVFKTAVLDMEPVANTSDDIKGGKSSTER